MKRFIALLHIDRPSKHGIKSFVMAHIFGEEFRVPISIYGNVRISQFCQFAITTYVKQLPIRIPWRRMSLPIRQCLAFLGRTHDIVHPSPNGDILFDIFRFLKHCHPSLSALIFLLNRSCWRCSRRQPHKRALLLHAFQSDIVKRTSFGLEPLANLTFKEIAIV